MKCYGVLYGKQAECPSCRLRRHCSKAGDPPLLAQNALPDELNDLVLAKYRRPTGNRFSRAE